MKLNLKIRIIGSIIFAILFYTAIESGNEIFAIPLAIFAIILAITGFSTKNNNK